MAVAIRTDSFVSPTLTQQLIYDGIKSAFSSAGYPAPIDEFSSGTEKVVVYAAILDATKTYGTSYLRIRVTTGLVIAQQLFSTWNAVTHVGTNGSTELTYTALASNVAVNLISLNGSAEYKLVLLYQGTIYINLGFIAPENRPIWWDLNSWNFAFIFMTSAFTGYRSTNLNPFGTTDNDTLISASSRLSSANPITNRRDILPGIVLFNQSNNGISGRTSDDWVTVYANGLTKFDTIQIPNSSNQYLLLAPGNGGLAVRVI